MSRRKRGAMTEQRRILEMHVAEYEETVRGLKSYVRELTEMAARHDTDAAHVEDDLAKAKGDIEFYEGQISHIAEMLGREAGRAAFRVYRDAAGEWRWRLTAGNNRTIADSGEGYRNRQDCLHATELVKGSTAAPVEDAD